MLDKLSEEEQGLLCLWGRWQEDRVTRYLLYIWCLQFIVTDNGILWVNVTGHW